jgi:L-iditol 2-dehydrogenase
MKVAALYGAYDIRIEEWDVPVAGPKQVLIKVACCGICGTELHMWQGHDIAWLPNTAAGGPQVWGHEYAGTVVGVGEGVSLCQVGDRVTVVPWVGCGKCFYCRNGIENFCTGKATIYDSGSGAWAEYSLVPEAAVYKIPDDMTFEVASLSEPLSCCLHAVDRARIQSGSSVCVIGAGPMGLLLVALVKASGACQVIVSEPSPTRRVLAAEIGADVLVNPMEENLQDAVKAATRGYGVDYSFEAVGRSSTVRQAMDVVRAGGTVAIVGVANKEDKLPVSPFEVYARDLVILGSVSRSYAYDRTVRWLSSLNVKPLLTHKFKLDDIVTAVQYSLEGRGGKILVEP